jgi:hypothetical protein
MPKTSTAKPNIVAMREKLKGMRPQAASNPVKEAVRELVPIIDQKRAEGFSLRQIYDVLKGDLAVKETTFKAYYRAVKPRKNKDTNDDQ